MSTEDLRLAASAGTRPAVEPKQGSAAPAQPSKKLWPLVRIVHGAVAVLTLIALIGATWAAHAAISAGNWSLLLDRHGPALLGIPAALGVATILTSAARAIEGPLRIDFLGFRSEGAVAAVVCWVLTFGTVALAVRALW